MKIVVHDFGGYAFPLQLSRELAKRGHKVHHVCFASLPTPRGAVAKKPSDPRTFELTELSLPEPYEKSALLRRYRQEKQYGRLISAEVRRIGPEVVLSANAPLVAQAQLLNACRADGIRFVYWVQDLRGEAIGEVLSKKLPLVGGLIGARFARMERSLLRQSHASILITDDFLPILNEWRIPPDRLHVIPNWAPLDEISLQPRDNAWSVKNGLTGKICLLYSGTLGRKHNPELLFGLAASLRGNERVRIVVVAEGAGADWLRTRQQEQDPGNLLVLGFQPYAEISRVLASGDALIAILEPDAARYSVPSKVLSYLCAGRPLLVSVPPDNLAARIVERNNAGIVVSPADPQALLRAAEKLISDAALRKSLGQNARDYAEAHFDIEGVCDRFEKILSQKGA